MTSPCRVGLLPLYVALYDSVVPKLIEELHPFLEEVGRVLEGAGLKVESAPACRVKADFAAAVRRFETAGVDAIVTLHLAYSPSLESADVLAATRLPVLMLDTTPDRSFGRDVDPNRLLCNHGIHGVQDLASMLRRRGKSYEVVAGHLSDPRVIERLAGRAKAARAARLLRSMKVLRVGKIFEGMGDFLVEPDELKRRLGIQADAIPCAALAPAVLAVSDGEIEREMALDRERFDADLPTDVHRRSVRLGLGLRRLLEAGGYGAMSMNFLSFDTPEEPVSTAPFLECSKAMARGIGYAGEGDVLTASLQGALQSAFGATSFVEMFCPDWEGNSIFLSHMGEINPEIAAAKPRLYEKEYLFSRALPPACLAAAPRPGPATYVNLAPGLEGTFRLIMAPVEVLPDGTHPDLRRWVRGWIRPELPVADFLEAFSLLGGTHHGVLMLGRHEESLKAFAAMAGLEGCPIRGSRP